MRTFLLYMILALTLSSSVHAQIQVNCTMYKWLWAGTAFDENCDNEPNLKKLGRDFMKNFKYAGESPRYNSEIDDFFKIFELEQPRNIYEVEQEITKKDISVLGFLAADKIFYTLRIFIYDNSQSTLINGFVLTCTGKEELERSMKEYGSFLTRAIQNNTYFDLISDESHFLNCLFKYRYEYLYDKYMDFMSNPPEGAKKPYVAKRVTALNIIQGIQYYYNTGNYEYLKGIRGMKGKPDHKMYKRTNRIFKKYPNMWKMIETIIGFEDYKNTSADRRIGVRAFLENRIDSLGVDLDFTYQEKRDYSGVISHQYYAQSLSKSAKMIFNCELIYGKAKAYANSGEYSKAASVYLDVLKNKNLTVLLKIIRDIKEESDCKTLKKDAYEKCTTLLELRTELYLENLNRADSFLLKGKCKKAKEFYEKAFSIGDHISLYPKKKIEEIIESDCFEKRPPSVEGILVNIERIFADKADIPYDNMDVTPEGYKVTHDKDKAEITFFFAKGENWINEVNYILGEYTSINDEYVSIIIEGALKETFIKHHAEIEYISITYIGSSDNTPWKGSLFVEEKYKTLNQKVKNCNSGESLKFKNLIKKANNYSKNLALAFLRAYNRYHLINNRLKGYPVVEILRSDFCANVAEAEGQEYRKSEVEIKIGLKGF